MAMTNINLRRTGDRLLQFTGQILCMVSTKEMTTSESGRWHEIELYLTAGGKYVVAVGYRTLHEGELPDDSAVVLDTENDVAEFLKNGIDPAAHLTGLPADDDMEKIKTDLAARYRAAVSRVLNSLGPEKLEI